MSRFHVLRSSAKPGGLGMSLNQWLVVAVTVAPVLFVCYAGWQQPPGPPAAAQTPPPASERLRAPAQKIELAWIYSTNGQKGLRPVTSSSFRLADGTREYAQTYGLDLANIRKDFHGGGPNAFLVRADDFTNAVRATSLACLGSRSLGVPIGPDDNSEHTHFWLVAHFGTTGSDPPAWLIQSAQRRGNALRLTYVGGQPETKDMHHYFAWVPLGWVEPGTYTLELFDAEKKQATLRRRVEIPEP